MSNKKTLALPKWKRKNLPQNRFKRLRMIVRMRTKMEIMRISRKCP